MMTRGMVYALLLACNLIYVEMTYLDWNAFCFVIRNLIDVPVFGSRLIGAET